MGVRWGWDWMEEWGCEGLVWAMVGVLCYGLEIPEWV